MKNYVIAIGGNALEEEVLPKALISYILRFHSKKIGIILVHGNGPQVGELAEHEHKNLAVLTAQTQAEIGLELKRRILAFCTSTRKRIPKIAVVITRVSVKENSEAFKHPTKPIGKSVGASAAIKLESKGITMKKLIGGYRRVVPSPKPIQVLDKSEIEDLVKSGYIVIAGGGGGVPMVNTQNGQQYVEAVIDKDYTAALIASEVKADRFFILTAVDGVYRNFGTPESVKIESIKISDLSKLLSREQFEAGSIRPKMIAALDYVKRSKKTAVIGSLSNADKTLRFKGATLILP